MRVCYFSRGTSLYSNRSKELPYDTHVTRPFLLEQNPTRLSLEALMAHSRISKLLTFATLLLFKHPLFPPILNTESMTCWAVIPETQWTVEQSSTERVASVPEDGSSVEHGINDMVGGHSRDAMAVEQSSTEHVASVPEEDSSVAVPEDDISEFLLSVLALSGRPKFTDQDHAIEKANMADEEKARVLADLFGKYCSVRENKKAKRDLSKDDVAFLVKQMRLEIDKIPESEKEALIEARAKCRAEDFSDSRMEKFLRCEKMDVKVRGSCFFTVDHVNMDHSHIGMFLFLVSRVQLGARRFVNYWKCRREVFGADKYVMKMTLSEALRDDLTALETCMFCLLPRLDLSGRQILYLDPSRHSREGYTSDSMVSAKSAMYCSFCRGSMFIPFLIMSCTAPGHLVYH